MILTAETTRVLWKGGDERRCEYAFCQHTTLL